MSTVAVHDGIDRDRRKAIANIVDRQEVGEALELYYNMAGWGNNGVPTKAKLAELDLLWAA